MAIISIILFILTQDMRLPMVLVDWMTVIHAVLLVGGLVCYVIAFTGINDEEGEDDDQFDGFDPWKYSA